MNTILRISLNLGLVILSVIAALIPNVMASADDSSAGTAVGDVSDPGILPDSGLYFLKGWGRNLQLMLAGSDAEKARLMLKYTGEDALALQKMYQMGKYEVGTRHAEQYALQLKNTIQTMEQVRTRLGNSATEELVEKLEQNYLRQQEVLLSVLENAPEKAQNGLLNALVNSNKRVAELVMVQNGEQALQQYQEQVNQQTKNMGQETKLVVQQRLEVKHGQAAQSSDSNSSGQGVMNLNQSQNQNQIQTQTQTQDQLQTQNQAQNQTQTMQQSGQQSGQQNVQTQGTGQSSNGSQGSSNQQQGR